MKTEQVHRRKAHSCYVQDLALAVVCDAEGAALNEQCQQRPLLQHSQLILSWIICVCMEKIWLTISI